MNQEEAKQRFKKVSDQVDSMARELEEDIRKKNASIREETSKKFASVFGSASANHSS
jgi:hypothetical protein